MPLAQGNKYCAVVLPGESWPFGPRPIEELEGAFEGAGQLVA